MKKCKHRKIISSPERCYSGPVSQRRMNPSAHGGITWTETCQGCGAERAINANGIHVETGEWIEATDAE